MRLCFMMSLVCNEGLLGPQQQQQQQQQQEQEQEETAEV